MGKIIDLGILVKDPLIFIDKNKEKYTIPGEIPTQFVIKLYHYFQSVENINDDAEAFLKAQEIVADILSLDKSKNIDLKYVQENFDDVRLIKLIISETMKHINEIANNDPNAVSPKSETK